MNVPVHTKPLTTIALSLQKEAMVKLVQQETAFRMENFIGLKVSEVPEAHFRFYTLAVPQPRKNVLLDNLILSEYRQNKSRASRHGTMHAAFPTASH